jgi:hypothetical protein
VSARARKTAKPRRKRRRPEEPPLVGHQAILECLGALGIPVSRRSLHRWMTELPELRRPPVKDELVGRRLRLVSSREKLEAWVRSMRRLYYPGFRRVEVLAQRRAANPPPEPLAPPRP